MLVRVYVGNIVHSLSAGELEILPDGIVGVDENGKILFRQTGSLEDALLAHGTDYNIDDENSVAEVEVVETTGNQFFVPGFIDTHIHASQYPNVGIFGHSTLLDWLETYTFPLEGSYTDTERATEVYTKVIGRGLANGTTMASYYGTIHVPATVCLSQIALKLGQRALVGRVCMERFCPETVQDASIESDRDFVDQVLALDKTGRHVKPILTPRFAPSCTMETMKGLAELAKERDLPVQTHISENSREIAWVKELFPECNSYTDVYDNANLLKHDTVLAHAVHLGDDEVELIKKRESGISHCPVSNASIASGIAPIKSYLDKNVKVSLGTDVSGGFTTSILANAREALLMSRLLSERSGNTDDVLSVNNALFIATLGGAQVCNASDFVGNFAVGKQWDAQLINLDAKGSPVDVFNWQLPQDPVERIENLVHKWVYVGDDRNTEKVWVDGKLVVDKC